MRIVLLALVILATPARAEDLAPDRWLRHLTEDLLPFWTHPDALGGEGLYPSVRCNTGEAVNPKMPCPEVARFPWLTPAAHHIVALSRQAYAYGVAFHLTGAPAYLAHMRRGVAALTGPALNPETGGHFRQFDQAGWGPKDQRLTLQEQAYALLAPAFYYYLTRDPAVLETLRTVRQSLLATYLAPETGAYALHPRAEAPADEGKLAAYIDQINAFYLLVTPLLAPEERTAWQADLAHLARETEARFYDPQTNSFRPDLRADRQKVHFGYTIKTFWFLQMTASLLGEQTWAEDLGKRARQALRRSFAAGAGAWADRLEPDTAVRTSWIFAEQNQFAASASIADPSLRAMLAQTQALWFTDFVDPVYGGTYDMLDPERGPIPNGPPKHWPWKAGFHSFEHALVAYIAGGAITETPIALYYAFDERPAYLQPYYFTAKIDAVETKDQTIRVTFSAIRYAGE
ncbi:MAG: AGE family epimerase/isomerase [Pseudomonadota bacterium]